MKDLEDQIAKSCVNENVPRTIRPHIISVSSDIATETVEWRRIVQEIVNNIDWRDYDKELDPTF